ncbi:MAG: hypothetical protein M4D80_04425 [Myxococcota bacterium]|nr:hypothetical protein [Myxococcota bacterium]
MPAFLQRRGWLLAIAIAYLYVFPYFPKIRTANELPRVYLVKAIADEHRFEIDTGVQRWGSTADVSPSHGHQYSNKAPGSSMLAAPAYLAVRLVAGEPSLGASMWIARVFTGVIPMLMFLALLWGFLERFAPDPAVRRLVLVAYGLGSMAMTFSILFFSHQLAACCIASAWILALDVADKKRGLLAMSAAGALAGAAALVDYQAVFAAVPVAVHVLWKLRTWPRRELARAVAIAVAGAAVPIGILLAYHAACFGSPWRTGYDASETFAHYHQQGFLGITKLRWDAFVGSFVRRDNGLFFLSPWLLLAFPGAFLMLKDRAHRAYAIVGIAVVVLYVLFISSINFWRGGWGVGPRYITAMLPFMLPLVAVLLSRVSPLVRGALAGTIVVGVVVYAMSSATFPYWPESVKHPLFDVTFHLLADGLVAPNLGTALGIGGLASIAPYVLVVGGLLGVSLQRACGWRGFALAAGIGIAILVAYSALPYGDQESRRAYSFVRASVIGD